ncbi:hypothetical protein BDN70DRAFT_489272 [Pholiota conissans]|uniref:Uncharacterized protein n=1 Tax=Pholiota conissans TaxID=109636 RepID=A0A9P5YRF1_9AGAR|nr:hypothetical protein BDN70DRAFT_489272 [Pholiota conissans]
MNAIVISLLGYEIRVLVSSSASHLVFCFGVTLIDVHLLLSHSFIATRFSSIQLSNRWNSCALIKPSTGCLKIDSNHQRFELDLGLADAKIWTPLIVSFCQSPPRSITGSSLIIPSIQNTRTPPYNSPLPIYVPQLLRFRHRLFGTSHPISSLRHHFYRFPLHPSQFLVRPTISISHPRHHWIRVYLSTCKRETMGSETQYSSPLSQRTAVLRLLSLGFSLYCVCTND